MSVSNMDITHYQLLQKRVAIPSNDGFLFFSVVLLQLPLIICVSPDRCFQVE